MAAKFAPFCLVLLIGIADRAEASDYARTIKPLFEQRCVSCHGPLKQEAELRLDSAAMIRQGGENGQAVAPGKPSESLLIQRVTASDPEQRMPPEGAPLSTEQVDVISAWISAGAAIPEDEKPAEDPRRHWAFQKVGRPKLPERSDDWGHNPIDAFILEKYSQHALEPLPQADKLTLFRRLYLDLVGVPPSLEQLRAYQANQSVDAYEKVVDRLLDSPQYGQRWGRHWMDIWRYSDWYGRRAVPDVMNSYPHIWRWRDWIVNSLNADKGYDRMVKEMLAADELAPSDDENVVATGFIVRNWFKWNYENWMKDNVEHTAKAFLGLTLNCAHCHDHKYDPLTQADYFRFRAFFEPLELRQDRVPGLPDPGPFVKYVYAKAYGPSQAGMVRVFDEKPDAPTFMYEKGDARNRFPNKAPVQPGVPVALAYETFAITPVDLPPGAFYPGIKQFVREDEHARHRAEIASAEQQLKASKGLVDATDSQVDDLRSRLTQPSTASNLPSVDALQSVEHAAMDARLQYRIDQQNWTFSNERLRSLQARIAADDAKYRSLGDPHLQAQIAFRAEKQSAYEETQLRISKAEQTLILSQRKPQTDPKTAAATEKAKQELDQARAALDAARAALNTSGEAYTPLSPVYPRNSTGRRLALANWIASRENPLTARVAVNHLWLRHFGRGLVDTPSNFGRSGNPPSHPELLDWLAAELMDSGWSMKSIHRQIVTSRTYRLRSHLGAASHANQRIDPDNIYLWRANTQRMEAEVVRDSLIACAGELDRTLGGQEIDPATWAASRRRSLYFAIHGEAKMQFLELFDAPDVCDCYQRTSSVRPQQALALTNSELPLELSRIHATRLWSLSPVDDSNSDANLNSFVRAAFESILSRPPTEAEATAAKEYLAGQFQLLEDVDPREVNATAASSSPAVDPSEQARQSFVHALFSHNDFVTIR